MQNTNKAMDNSNYKNGMDYLRRIEATEKPSIIEGLAEIAPDLAKLAISFVYGEIYSRPHLELRDRQLITIAVLAALGNARPQLKFHIAGALNVGCSATEIIEIMMHLVVYAGFPVGLNGVFAAQEVFYERGVTHVPASAADSPDNGMRFRAGWDALAHIDGLAGEKVIAALANVAGQRSC